MDPRPPLWSLALAALLLPAGCVAPALEESVSVFSEPAGAEVLVDGVATGLYTPCDLELSAFRGARELELRKPGYASGRRSVVRRTAFELSRPSEAGAMEAPELFPLYWTATDFLLPFQFTSGIYPRKLFVRLVPAAPADA